MRDAQRQLCQSLQSGPSPPIAAAGAGASAPSAAVYDHATAMDAEVLHPPHPAVGHQAPAAATVSSSAEDLSLANVDPAKAVKTLFNRARLSVPLEDRDNVEAVRTAMLEAAFRADFDPKSSIASFRAPAIRTKISRAPSMSADVSASHQAADGKRGGAASTSAGPDAGSKRLRFSRSPAFAPEPTPRLPINVPSSSLNAELRPLNDGETEKTTNVFKPGAHPTTVLLPGRTDGVCGSVPLLRCHLQCLGGDAHLNEEVANRVLVSSIVLGPCNVPLISTTLKLMLQFL